MTRTKTLLIISLVLLVSLPVLAGQKIAFESSRDGNQEIYLMNPDGTNQSRMTNNPAFDTYPALSPDGSKIAFVSDRAGNYEIYVMNAVPGSVPTRLTNNGALDYAPAFSPDGTKIVFYSNRDFVAGNEIFVMNATDGSGLTRLTNNTAGDAWAAFSPDGSKIVFSSDRDGNLEIYTMNATNGSNVTRLTNNPANDWLAEYSPDSSKIVFTSNRDGNNEIYVMNAADGSNPTNMTNHAAHDEGPTFSPDGSKIAFASMRVFGFHQIFTMDYPSGLNVTQLTSGFTHTTSPSWGGPKTAPPVLSNVAVITPVNENDYAALTGNISDADSGDTFTLTVDWGDGSTAQVFNYGAGTTFFSETHQFNDDNPTGTSSDNYTISLTLSDNGGGGTDTDSAIVTVNNREPVLSNTSANPATIPVGGTTTLSGTVTDVGTLDTHQVVINWGDGSSETWNLTAGVTDFNSTHQYNVAGTFNITVTATDDDTGSASGGVSVTVTAVNYEPTAVNDAYSVNEDTPLNIAVPGVLGNDFDANNDPITAIKITDPANGTLILNTDGSFSYIPNTNFNGTDTFKYKAYDEQVESNEAIVTITVNSVNDPPIAKNDFYTISQNSGAPSVLVNDADVEGPMTAVLVSQPAHGTLTLNPDGTFTYVPAQGSSGPDSFTYKVSDGVLESNVATASVNNTCSISWKSAADGLWNDAANWDQNLVPTANDDVCIGLDGLYVVTMNSNQAAANITIGSSSVGVGPTLNIQGGNLTAGGDITNSGEIRLDSTVEADDVLSLSSGVLNNMASGVINVNAGSGGARTISGNLTNQGTVNINPVTSFTNGTFTQNAGRLNSFTGGFLMTAGTFTFTGGTISGTVSLRDSTLNNNPTNPGGIFYMSGNSHLSGTILSGQQVFVLPIADGTTLTINGNLTNAGYLSLTSLWFDPELQNGDVALVIPTGTLTNWGTLIVEQPIGTGARTISGNLVNETGISIKTATSLNDGLLTNNGNFTSEAPVTLTNISFTNVGILRSSGSSFLMRSGTFTFNSGTVDGTISLEDSTLNNNPSSLSIANNDYNISGLCYLSGTILYGQQVFVVPVAGGTTLTVNGNLTNAGELHLGFSTQGETGDVALVIPSGTFTNNRMVFVDQTSGVTGARTISGNFINQDTVRINISTTLSLNSGTFTNVFPASIVGHGILSIGTGATFLGNGTIQANVINAGEFNPGLSPGVVNIDGSYTQNAPGKFVAEIAGPDAGTSYDQMNVNGDVTINGGTTLHVQVIGGYCPQGTSFRIITSRSLAGDFSTKTIDNPSGGSASTSIDAFGYHVTFSGSCNNSVPVAMNDSATTPEDSPVTLSVLSNDSDPDNDPLSVTSVTTPAHGTALINSGTTITYTPASSYSGQDSFQYSISDGQGGTATATVTITVNAVNHAPTAVDDSYNVGENGTRTISAPGVLSNDSDPDGDSITAVLQTSTSNGILTFNEDGSFTYTPNSNYNGTDSFTYLASDGNLLSNSATVTITINAVNHAPSAVNDSYNVDENGTRTISAPGVLSNDSDPDGDSIRAVLQTSTSNGILTFNEDGSFTYSPNSNYNGTDSFTYLASDGNLLSNSATVTITVNAVNHAPIAVDDSYSVDQVLAPGVLGNDSDPDGDSITAVLVTSTSNGILTFGDDGSFTYVPNSNFNGTDSFTYKANDGTAVSNVATVAIIVTAVDTYPPVLTLPGNLMFEATSPGGAIGTYTASATDAVDGPRPVSCHLPSGTLFPIGATTVNCSASDLSGNTANGSFNISVVDTTNPVLTLPANFTVNATGPSGAIVTYSVSATDIADATVAVSCSPASGAIFGVGTTTVSCSATDNYGNTTSGSFLITVTSAATQITDLISLVNSFAFPKGITNSLVSKLQAALNFINAGNISGACAKLKDFIDAVNAQTGKGITPAQASQLIASAMQINAVVGCP